MDTAGSRKSRAGILVSKAHTTANLRPPFSATGKSRDAGVDAVTGTTGASRQRPLTARQQQTEIRSARAVTG
jgi:hypothetical protein